MEDAEGDSQRGLDEVRIEGGELVRGAERLVGHGAERERGDVRPGGEPFGASPCTVGAGLGFVERRAERLQQDELLDARHARSGLRAERVRYDRDRAPPAQSDPLRGAGLLDRVAGGLLAQEDHRQPAPGRGNERPRNRQQDSGAVTRPPVGRDGAAMTKARQSFEHAVEDCARGPACRIGEKADAAGVAFTTQVVDRRMHGVAPLRLSVICPPAVAT